MKILIASDSFKGSADSLSVGESIEKGIKNILIDVETSIIPISDGGEGTMDALINATKGSYVDLMVTGPSGNKINARYGVIYDEIAVIEMASASGMLVLKNGILDPLNTTTFGTGELIKSAIEDGYKKIYVAIGGSATSDGGVGMAQALGFSFLDNEGNELGFGGGELSKLSRIDSSNKNKLLENTEITVLSDVDNPLYGLNGSAFVYGPQKGATKEDILLLDDGLKNLAIIINEFNNIDISNVKGAGAAGGLGGGLIAFCEANLQSGVDIILDILKFKENLTNTNIVITGEGRIDGQSKQGKVPIGVARLSKRYNVPVIAVTGGIGEDVEELYNLGIDLILPIVDKPMELEEAMKNAPKLLTDCGERIGRIIKLASFLN